MSLEQTYKRLIPIINGIDKAIICSSVVNNVDGTYTFACGNTKWLTVGFDVTIGLNTYNIVDINCNASITVSGSVLPTALTFDAYEPIFKYGTIKRVASELNELQDFKQRTPLIFLHEINEEVIHFDQLDAVENDIDCSLYFLTNSDFSNWTQDTSNLNGVNPMRNLINEFIKSLAVNENVKDLSNTGTIKNYNIFGNQDNNGAIKNLFNEPLSGCRLKINISFLKGCDCCEGTPLDNRPAPAYVYDSLGNVLAVLYSNEIYISSGSGVCADVTIKDYYTNDVITTVTSGGEYKVIRASGVRDTIDSNLETIIDNII